MTHAMILCAVKGDPDYYLRPGLTATEIICGGTCGRTLLVSPTSLAVPNADFYCNQCGNATLLAQQTVDPRPIDLRIAPGALPTGEGADPADRRRRNELEARGFRQATVEELNRG